ncbi:hypothetical protein [Micromonospora inyonensis]|uniref:Uncharacterized protein n=1 Tax=Micromonospora inyonensis TaxID=47866 RepID=A0A1C6SQ24_9ACTN|nr:hypothetical protein [Micromonospora inyonensis]SCL31630.1 hypothetical protein GA0074694_6039 [Micromonospora inyonensis]
MTITADRSTTIASDPRTLVTPEVFSKLVDYFAADRHVTRAYAERAVEQFLVFLKAHADNVGNPDFGMPLPDGSIGRVVPTLPVDAVWHSVLQHTVPYAAACEQIAGGFVHHIPILTEGMMDGTAVTFTLAALHATGYRVEMEFWAGEAESCCPPNPPMPGEGK